MINFVSVQKNSSIAYNCQISDFTIHKKPLNLGVQSFIGFSGIQVSNNFTIGGILFFYKHQAMSMKPGKVVKIFSTKKPILGIYGNYSYSQFSEICEYFNSMELPSFTLKLNLQSPKTEKLQQFQLIPRISPNLLVLPKSLVAAGW